MFNNAQQVNKYMPKELIVFFTSMIPFVDLKFAIPLGMKMGLPAITTAIYAIIGSIIPGILILLFLEPLSNFFRKRSKLIDSFFTKLFAKTRNKHLKNIEKYEALFIILFIIVPLPGSGPGAGSLIAFVFGIKFWKAALMVTIGGIGSGILVVSSVTSIVSLFNFLT